MELSNILIVFYLVALLVFLASVICLWKRFKEDTHCFIYDLFMSASSGLTLALAATVMYQTNNINAEINNSNISKNDRCNDVRISLEKRNPLIKGSVSFECLSFGDGDLACEWIPGSIE